MTDAAVDHSYLLRDPLGAKQGQTLDIISMARREGSWIRMTSLTWFADDTRVNSLALVHVSSHMLLSYSILHMLGTQRSHPKMIDKIPRLLVQ